MFITNLILGFSYHQHLSDTYNPLKGYFKNNSRPALSSAWLESEAGLRLTCSSHILELYLSAGTVLTAGCCVPRSPVQRTGTTAPGADSSLVGQEEAPLLSHDRLI